MNPLVFDIGRPVRAALRVEVTGGGRLLLRQGDTAALLARVDDDRAGVEYAAQVRSHRARLRSPEGL